MSTSVSLGRFGERVSGLAQQHQAIRLICENQRGSVPHDPLFGVDWLAVLDRPLPEVVPVLSLDIQMQLKKYAPWADVRAIEILNTTNPGTGKARVTWRPKDDERAPDQVTEIG